MKPALFEYHRPNNLDQALDRLAELGERAKILAGGQSLVPLMNFRLATPEHVIDINELTDLDFLAEDEGGLRIGALTRHRTLEWNGWLPRARRSWRKPRVTLATRLFELGERSAAA